MGLDVAARWGCVVSTTKVTKYTIYPNGYDGFVNSDKSMWTLNVELRRADEPQPSSRTKKWLKRYRFPLDVALAIADKYVDSLVWNGCTAAEASALVAARKAGGES